MTEDITQPYNPRNEISTDYVCPPIPERSHDWEARISYHDGDTDLVGHGSTEERAVLDLLKTASEYGGDGSEQETLVDMAFSAWSNQPTEPRNSELKPKCGDFVVALDAAEGTKVGYPYKVISIFHGSGAFGGVSVELHDGSDGGLYTHQYTLLTAATRAEPAKSFAVKPLDLSNALKHAFMYGVNSGSYAWPDYDPTDNKAYQRISQAITETPDTRNDALRAAVAKAKEFHVADGVTDNAPLANAISAILALITEEST